MSDDADNFFDAWKRVFTTSNTKKLICTRHLDIARGLDYMNIWL